MKSLQTPNIPADFFFSLTNIKLEVLALKVAVMCLQSFIFYLFIYF